MKQLVYSHPDQKLFCVTDELMMEINLKSIIEKLSSFSQEIVSLDPSYKSEELETFRLDARSKFPFNQVFQLHTTVVPQSTSVEILPSVSMMQYLSKQ